MAADNKEQRVQRLTEKLNAGGETEVVFLRKSIRDDGTLRYTKLTGGNFGGKSQTRKAETAAESDEAAKDEESAAGAKTREPEKSEKTGKKRKAGTIGKAGKARRGSTEGAVTGRPLDSGARSTGMWLVTVWMCEQWHDSL